MCNGGGKRTYLTTCGSVGYLFVVVRILEEARGREFFFVESDVSREHVDDLAHHGAAVGGGLGAEEGNFYVLDDFLLCVCFKVGIHKF